MEIATHQGNRPATQGSRAERFHNIVIGKQADTVKGSGIIEHILPHNIAQLRTTPLGKQQQAAQFEFVAVPAAAAGRPGGSTEDRPCEEESDRPEPARKRKAERSYKESSTDSSDPEYRPEDTRPKRKEKPRKRRR